MFTSRNPTNGGACPWYSSTAPSAVPIWWAEMMNTLRSDPEIRQRCQFWFFIYNSGNPMPYSAAQTP